MKEGRASFSAEVMALYRAAESARPEADRLYFDPLAKHFLHTPLRLLTRSRLMTDWAIWFFAERQAPGSVGIVLARSRYIDDCLKDYLAEGIGQLVILGAGYDARAYRFSALKVAVRVFEADHPATQAVKTRKLRSLLGSLPSHVVYAPIDLMKGALEKTLFESGYDRNLKTLFICEGVTYYLSAEAVDEILAFAAHNSAKGSSMVFDYFVQMTADEANESGISLKKLDQIAQSARRQGEPVIFRLQTESAGEFLSSRGFHLKANVTALDLKKLYFQGANRRRKVSPHLAIVHATVN
jgi:methyltransferase (TIGR00027 family)